MTPDELLNAIIDNFADLHALSIGEFFFEIGLDGSSLDEEREIIGIMRSNRFRQKLRESHIDFSVDRNGKLHFAEVVTNEQ